MLNLENLENKENQKEEKKKKTEFEKLKETSEDLEFKTEGLGAIEFTKRIFLRSFEEKGVKFRIERIPFETFGRIGAALEKINLKDIKSIEKILKAFIAFPVEARELEYYELDLDAMLDILNIITEFQEKPFLYFNGTRKAKAEITV